MGIIAEEFQKGNVLIVGKRIKNNDTEYEIDGVLVYDSYCLSSGTPYLLQEQGIKLNPDEPIYICGHGKKKEQTISDYTMKELVEMIYNNTNLSSIHGTLYIMSCYGKYKKKKKDMSDLLRKEMNSLYKNNNLVFKNKVKSVCKETTIVVDYFGKALVSDIKETKFGFSVFNIKQGCRLKKYGCESLSVKIGSVQSDLKNYLNCYGTAIAVDNYKYILKGCDIHG